MDTNACVAFPVLGAVTFALKHIAKNARLLRLADDVSGVFVRNVLQKVRLVVSVYLDQYEWDVWKLMGQIKWQAKNIYIR